MAKKRSNTAGDKLRDRLSDAKSRFQGRTPRTRTRKRSQAQRVSTQVVAIGVHRRGPFDGHCVCAS
jgi:hypothetical protein